MKLIASILFCHITICIYGQNAINDPIYFKITCGFAAQTDNIIQNFRGQSQLTDSLIIKQKLLGGTDLEQILCAIILKHYYSNGQLSLSPIELSKMAEISNSKRPFELCYTCTFHEKGTLKELFKKKKAMASYEIIKNYILE